MYLIVLICIIYIQLYIYTAIYIYTTVYTLENIGRPHWARSELMKATASVVGLIASDDLCTVKLNREAQLPGETCQLCTSAAGIPCEPRLRMLGDDSI